MKTHFHLSKSLAIGLLACCMALMAQATTVKLKITYKGIGVADNDVTIKHGDVSLGSGRTNSTGDVSINASGLVSKEIDIYGHVETSEGYKNWKVTGWATLDANNFFHLEMQEVFDAIGAEGEFMAEAWGLIYSTRGVRSGPSPSSNPGSVSNSPKSGGSQSDDDRPVVHREPAAPAKPSLPAGYKCNPVGGSDFSRTKNAVASESFSSGKMGTIKSFFRSECYDANQAKQLIELLDFDNDRLAMAKEGYDNVANPGSYYSIVSATLKMSFDRDKLRDYIDVNSASKSAAANDDDDEEEEDDDDDDFVSTRSEKPATYNQPSKPATVVERPVAQPNSNSKPEPAPQPAAPTHEPDKISFRTENGELFTAYLEGEQMNATPSNDVMGKLPLTHNMTPRVKLVFENKTEPVIEKRVVLTGVSDYYVFIIKKNNKGEWVIKPKL